MKIELKICSRCGEETLHDVGKKQAHKSVTHYTRRTTSRCRQCGTKEINNRFKGKRIIPGVNDTPNKQEENK